MMEMQLSCCSCQNSVFHMKSNHAILRVGALAAATLLFESALTRLLAVAQFYHFAFLVVSLALLGFGASGTLLSVFPRLRSIALDRALAWAGLCFAFGVGLAYGVVNWLPFDSYSIAWERRQILYFLLYYLALTIPFLFSGLGIGLALARSGERSHLMYAANLIGSALGALLAPALLWLGGVPGAVLVSALIGLGAAISFGSAGADRRAAWRQWGLISISVTAFLGFAFLSVSNLFGDAPLGMTISPYKGLSHALRYPGSERRFGRWNAVSRLDVITDAGTRGLPGLSYAYDQNPPPQLGLSVDATALKPISLVEPNAFDSAAWMPEALAFSLRPAKDALVLNPGGGLGVLQALAGDVDQVTAVIDNPLIRQAVADTAPETNPYRHPRVKVAEQSMRVFLKDNARDYDLVFLPLTDAYRPVTSGAYSLSEEYTLTVEAFQAALASLNADGILVVSRWAQTPPSESLRLIATLVEALDRVTPLPAAESLVAYRSIQTVTTLAKPGGWSQAELEAARAFLEQRRFDLVWAPDIRPEETNRFNRLPEPSYYQAVSVLLSTSDRETFYRDYNFDIVPTDDNHPFFFHFFTWQQTPQILSTLGRTWQPFGGSGYFLLLAMLILVVVLSGGLILLPLFLRTPALATETGSTPPRRDTVLVFLYFALLGIAFLFVEIPLIQRWILVLGHPIYAFTLVVAALLTFSGLGSALAGSDWLPARTIFAVLVLFTFILPLVIAPLSEIVLGWPAWARVGIAVLFLAPLGFLMGLPFPLGIAWLNRQAPALTPWAWAINGCASVIASVLAAILALGSGFTLVMLLGAGAYAGAFVAFHVGISAPKG